MTPEFWAILGVGAGIIYAIVVAASENEKRLDRIHSILVDIWKQGRRRDDDDTY